MAFDVTVAQDALERLLRASGRAIGGRAVQPVLSGVLLEAENGSLLGTGYDLALGIRASAPATASEAGEVVAPHRHLAALVGALPSVSLVRLRAEDGELHIEAGEGRYSLPLSFEPDDYPELPAVGRDQPEPLGCPYGAIRRALMATAFCAAQGDDGRPQLEGLRFLATGGEFRIEGIDGKRASFYSLPGIVCDDDEFDFIVPSEAIKQVLRLGLADDDLLLLSQADSFAVFGAPDTTLITNLLTGEFPPFYDLLPPSCKTEIILDRQAAISAVERVRVVADSEVGAIAISYLPETGDFQFAARTDCGSASDLIATEAGTGGDGFTVSISSRFLADALKHVETEKVSISFNDARLLKIAPVGHELHSQLVATIGKPEVKP